MRYFSEFPVIDYDGYFARDLLKRVGFAENFVPFKPNFYPYTVTESDRPDSLAYNYYDDAEKTWLIYLVNGVIDPYHDVHLTNEEFESYIEKKYGSIQSASTKIAFYRNNWDSDDQVLTTSAYEAKTSIEKFFWQPVISYSGSISGYERKNDSVIISTNKVIELTHTANSALTIGERLLIDSSNYGTVVFSNTTTTTLQHIVGSFPSASYTATGEDSNTTVNISASVTIQQTVNTNIQAYFSPVSFYTYETELNEQKKHINLLDNKYVNTFEKKFTSLINA